MALRKISGRDSVLCRTGDTPSPRSWATWDLPTDHPTVTVPNPEVVKAQRGKWRCEVLAGRALTYVDGKNMGDNGPGVYVYEGELAIYNQRISERVTMILTRLA